jgi:hypothetical protein
VPRVIVTGVGRPSRSLGCLGTVFAAFVFLVALVLIATVGLIALIVVAAGVVVASGVFLVRRLFHLGGRGGSPVSGTSGIIDTTATEVPFRSIPPATDPPEDERR